MLLRVMAPKGSASKKGKGGGASQDRQVPDSPGTGQDTEPGASYPIIPRRPATPPDDASDAILRIYDVRMQAYAAELQALHHVPQPVNQQLPKPLQFSVFDGTHAKLNDWIGMVEGRLSVRSWDKQGDLTAIVAGSVHVNPAAQVAIEAALRESVTGAARLALSAALRDRQQDEEDGQRWRAPGAQLIAHVAQSIRARERGTLFRQVDAMLDPQYQCVAGDRKAVLDHLSVHAGAVSDLLAAAEAEPGHSQCSCGQAAKVRLADAVVLGTFVRSSAALYSDLEKEFSTAPITEATRRAVIDKATALAKVLPVDAPPVRVAGVL